MIVKLYNAICVAAALVTTAAFVIWGLGKSFSLEGDSTPVPLGVDTLPLAAVLFNLTLFALFGVQHSVMARPVFKETYARLLPEATMRSTYLLATSLAIWTLLRLWRPTPQVLWEAPNYDWRLILSMVGWLGGLLALLSVAAMDPWAFLGIRQAWQRVRDGDPSATSRFQTPGAYRLVRHPIYLGWLMLVWSAPTMTLGRGLLAVASTVYILLAIRWEEKDLVAEFGESYREYQRRTPALIPIRLRASGRSKQGENAKSRSDAE